MIIGVVGPIGAGKGTFAKYLREEYDFVKKSFAGPVKDAIAIMFNWDRSLLEGDTDESRAWRETIDPHWSKIAGRDITPRLVLQEMGTEVGRTMYGDTFWIDRAFADIQPNINYVFDDTRFDNEIKKIIDAGGWIIIVFKSVDDFSLDETKHSSENSWIKFIKSDEYKEYYDRVLFVCNNTEKWNLYQTINHCIELIENRNDHNNFD
jgi:hypothetical protein